MIAVLTALPLCGIWAQDVSVLVTPVQQVLPPQAGQYIDNPGKFFTVRLINNSDDEQLVHMGMHIDMTYPEAQSMVVTPTNHIPRQPIVLAPRQAKVLNPVEMKNLFTHFDLRDIYIRDGLYDNYERGVFGLLPEGQYELFLQAYKWNPELTSAVQLNSPDNGSCRFTVCYTAQAPTFLMPLQDLNSDPMALLNVARLDINAPTITWTQPTMNCNPTFFSCTYNVKIVKLDGLLPDEAIEKNPIEFSREHLTTTTLTIPTAYITRMKNESKANKDIIYAMQVTANSSYANQNQLGFTLIENNGKSPVLLFRLWDPKEVDDYVAGSATDGKKTEDDGDSLYVFEQPTLTAPQFSKKTARKVFVGDSIACEWRKAWFKKGRGEKQDTINFEYTLALYRANSADTPEAIFTTKPVFEHKTENLKDTIKWKDIKDKVESGDYLMLRVTAKAKNEKSIRMLPDSLNYRDFVMTEHFDLDYNCGSDMAEIENQTPIKECPKAGTQLTIGEWTLELGDDVKQDPSTKGLTGTGFVLWTPGIMKIRVAVKFENLMVNTDNVVYEGVCNTYPDPNGKNFVDKEYSAQEAVNEMFSDWGLDNIWGDLGLPESVKKKVSDSAGGLAEDYDVGKYYSYFKQAEKQWDKWKAGNWLDLYFPTELPDTIANLLPDDFSLQIASLVYSPKAAVMNVIGEFVLPKVDVIKNDVLVFGAPRLCIEKDRFLPATGTLALLQNFTIKDPDSDWDLTFKAPAEPLRPTDGCFVSWEDDEFGGLGIEVAMHIPNLDRVVDGKVQKGVAPLADLKATIENNWGDWIGKITMDPFQVRDLPWWTFSPGKVIIYDHSYERNDRDFPFKNVDAAVKQYGDTYDPSLCGSHVKTEWKAWQGLYIDEISVQFPKWAVFGKGDEGFKIAAEKLIYDDSGISLGIAGLNILEAKTGKAGGWEFDIDSCVVQIVQNNFDNCHITGRFAVPLFGKKEGKDDGKMKFTCDIRHLTDPSLSTEYYTYEQKFDDKGKPIADQYEKVKHTRQSYGEKSRYAYLFHTKQMGKLQMDCFVADLDFDADQTYFALAAEEQTDGKTTTHLELSIGGDITIANANSVNEKLKKISKNLPLELKLPGIHFTKLYLSNFKRSSADAKNNMIFKYDKMMGNLEAKRQASEEKWQKEHKKVLKLADAKEIELSKSCYLSLGEWSLASLQKKIGPFNLELSSYKFNFSSGEKKLSLDVEGKVGFCGDVVTAGAGIGISTIVTIPSDYTNLSGYSLSDGKVEFKSVTLKCDFAALKLDGRLDVTDGSDGTDKGYAGKLDIDIVGLFGIKCKGGYFKHEGATYDEKQKLKKEAEEKAKKANAETPGLNATYADYYDGDPSYAWGYFTVDIQSDAGIRIDPLVINRIAGGFYFNSRPKIQEDPKTKKVTYLDPVGEYGMIGVSLGIGMCTSAGENTLSADMDLAVVYNKKANCLSTFLFKGNVKAVNGIVNANMTLLYENNSKDRFLQLDITVESSLEMSHLEEYVTDANSVLGDLQKDLNKFKKDLSSKVKSSNLNVNGRLDGMLDDDGDHDKHSASENTGKLNKDASKKADTSKNGRFGQMSISFQLKVTWREKNKNYSPVRWHLWLGQPQKEKRCKIQLVDYKSPGGIINVDIGADAYLCIGNELPDDGKLPDIPQEITDFISPNGVDTNADMAKAERSRKAAMQAMLPQGDNVKGGLMVGASAWGFIDINLGLFYGGLKAIAGFDMSLVNYDPPGYCANLHRSMGKDGWYAQGQFYAYLAAKFGLHIKLGKLIDKKIDIVDAGIGGVFSAGLPSPTWIDGRARVKLRLLSGLVNISKTFHFECGDYCEAFMGNALDGFSLFGDLSIASDSLDEGWSKENAILTRERNKAILQTEASLNSQYRLVDPTTQNQLAQDYGGDMEEFKLNAARTYIFDIEDNYNNGHGVTGVRLFEMTESNKNLFLNTTAGQTLTTSGSTIETNIKMKNNSLTSDVANNGDNRYNNFNNIINGTLRNYALELNVSLSEKRGTHFHVNMTLRPNRYYLMVLTGTGYEVENGKRVWPTLTEKNSKGNYESHPYHWIQRKLYYFCTKSQDEIPAYIDDLQPYVALAMPAGAECKLFNTTDNDDFAYIQDICSPTIALNRDISEKAYKEGTLAWELTSKDSRTGQSKDEKIKNVFTRGKSQSSGYNNYVNMEPSGRFNPLTGSNVRYNLRLGYTYQVPYDCEENNTYYVAGYNMNYSTTNNYGKWLFYRTFFNEYSLLNDFYTWYRSIGRTPYSGGTVNDTQYYLQAVYAGIWTNADKYRKDDYAEFLGKHKSRQGKCTKDTTVYLANWHFWATGKHSWQASGYHSKDCNYLTQPYERPFLGIRPQKAPEYDYDTWDGYKYSSIDYLSTTDTDESIYQNNRTYGYRKFDPYLYFAYLSNWVFIGGPSRKSYDFDDVPVSHAMETLTFTYNGIDVQGSAQIDGLRKSMYNVRNEMYRCWNNWHYDDYQQSGYDWYQPCYPLPGGTGVEYDATIPNQDGKASRLYTGNAKGSNYEYHMTVAEYYKDFMAPYFIAERLCEEMKSIAEELYKYYINNNNSNDKINQKMKEWSNKHRGQYLTLESRGFQVKVPYYQFPLIFGDCFGNGGTSQKDEKGGNPDRKSRSFGSSLGTRLQNDRWETPTSNLLFFRLFGGFPFKTWDKNKLPKKYNSNRDGYYYYVNFDKFDATQALSTWLGEMPLSIYRCNSYNMENGQYYPWNYVGANYFHEDFREKTVDPIYDSGSPVRLKVQDLINKVGKPYVKVNGGGNYDLQNDIDVKDGGVK